MKNSILLTIAAMFLSANVLASTCPEPSTFKYINGQWTAPDGWIFNGFPDGGPTDKVGNFSQVEWQAIVPGQSLGSIDWCNYHWVGQPGLQDLSVFWWGLPMFAKINNMQFWTQLSPGGTVFRCESGLANCSFTFTDGP